MKKLELIELLTLEVDQLLIVGSDMKNIFLIALSLPFFISQISFAEEMPDVSHKVQITQGDHYAVLRYYSPLDIRTIINPFAAKWEGGSTVSVKPYFNYEVNMDRGTYVRGQEGGGYDQYAQYFAIDGLKPGVLELSGPFKESAYFSLTVYNSVGGVTKIIKDKELNVSSGKLNPFVVNNPSIFSYTANSYIDSVANPTQLNSVPGFNKTIPLYRSDRYRASLGAQEDVIADGCSVAYLGTKAGAKQPEYMFLRMKMPTTFFKYNSKDINFKGYDVQELSISSTMGSVEDQLPVLDFWTVNSHMLSKTRHESDGYVNILFAPRDVVTALLNMQGLLGKRTPPMVTLWGAKAYVLGTPTHAAIIRYRDPSSEWSGSPANTPCYDNSATNMPIKDGALGEYTPVMYGADSYPELDKLTGRVRE